MRIGAVAGLLMVSAGLMSQVAHAQSVVVRQIFPGGGPTAPYGADFIELFNRSASAVSIGGWSLQCAPASPGSWQKLALPSISLAAGQSMLIRLAGGSTPALPTPDATALGINLSASGGVIAIVRANTSLLGCPRGVTTIEDLVGYGSTICAQGTPAVGPGLNQAIVRKSSGCQAGTNDREDFEVAVPTPRSRASTLEPCSAIVRTLSVEMVGPRPGVVDSQPGGIAGCDGLSGSCSGVFGLLSTVTLVPSSSPSYRLVGWTGPGSGFGTRTVGITADATVGVSFACWADLTGPGGPPAAADGDLSVEDFITFLTSFTDELGCPGNPADGPCNLADLTGAGGPPALPDGELSIEDFIVFLAAFSDGCP